MVSGPGEGFRHLRGTPGLGADPVSVRGGDGVQSRGPPDVPTFTPAHSEHCLYSGARLLPDVRFEDEQNPETRPSQAQRPPPGPGRGGFGVGQGLGRADQAPWGTGRLTHVSLGPSGRPPQASPRSPPPGLPGPCACLGSKASGSAAPFAPHGAGHPRVRGGGSLGWGRTPSGSSRLTESVSAPAVLLGVREDVGVQIRCEVGAP